MIKSFAERILNFKIDSRGLFNPFIGLDISSLGNYIGINQESHRECPILVSVASNRDNFSNLPITLYSLLNQEIKPDKIILWLDEDIEDFAYLPYEITQFVKNGLEIRFTKNLGCYTKSIQAFKDYSDWIIVTASDKVYYPSTWLKKLYLSYIANQSDIHVHQALLSDLNLSYNNWNKSTKESANYKNFLLGELGILFPPNCFGKEVLRQDIFLKYAPNSDNVWLWIMSLVHRRKIRVVKNPIKTTIYNNVYKHFYNRLKNKKNIIEANNNSLKLLLKLYGRNVNNRLDS